MNTLLLLTFIIFLLSWYLLLKTNTKIKKENYRDLSAAFIDLVTYDGIDPYLYN